MLATPQQLMIAGPSFGGAVAVVGEHTSAKAAKRQLHTIAVLMEIGPAHTLADAIRIFDPRRALEGEALRAFYAERGSDTRKKMRIHIEVTNGEPSGMLFTGHGGSGKSTELNKLVEELDKEYLVVKVCTSDFVAYSDLTYVDVVLIMAMALFRAASDEQLIQRAPAQIAEEVWRQVRQVIENVIFGHQPIRPSTSSEASFNLSIPKTIFGLTLEFESRFKSEEDTRTKIRERLRDNLSEVINKANRLIEEIQRRHRLPVLLIAEDTDKPDPGRAREIFFEHPQSLTAFKALTIYTFPVALRYNAQFIELDRYFKIFRMPNLALVHKDGTINRRSWRVLGEVIHRRLDPALIAPKARQTIIRASGGIMRLLIGLVQSAATNAHARGAQRIENSDAMAAVADLRKDFIAALKSEDYPILAARYKDKRLSNDDALQPLLQTRALLEYENDDTWCDVHPAILPLLEERVAGFKINESA